MKKNEELKKAFTSNFLKESPKELTSNVLQRIETSQQVKALLPSYVLWLLAASFLVIFVFLLFSIDTSSISFSPAAFVDLWKSHLSLFILPLCVLSLMFIQSVWLKRDFK